MLEIYVQVITVIIAIIASLFIIFWPSKDNITEDEWSKSFQGEVSPYLKLVIPPKAFIKSKSNAIVNKIMMIYKRGKLVKSKSQQSSANLSLDGEVIEHNGLNGCFYLQYMHKGSTPLITFVNSKSGGQKGAEVAHSALSGNFFSAKVLTPEICAIPGLIILVCGGDGTVSWIINCLLQLKQKYPLVHLPPFCIVPLGTGNDLSYALGNYNI